MHHTFALIESNNAFFYLPLDAGWLAKDKHTYLFALLDNNLHPK